MTKKEMFAALSAYFTFTKAAIPDCTNEEVVEFLEHEFELLDKKANQPNRPTKTQAENEIYKDLIMKELERAYAPATASEIHEAILELKPFGIQKVSALLTQLKKEGLIIRTEDKNTAYFETASREAKAEEEIEEA